VAIFVVTYDLNKESKRPDITGLLHKSFSYAQLSESSYAIDTTLTAEAVYKVFLPLLDGNDSLYVITLKRLYYGQGLAVVNEWLEKRLTY